MQLQWGRGRGRNIARPQLKNQSFCPISPSPLGSLVFHPFPVFLYFPLSTSRYPVSFSRERGLPSLVYTDTHLFTKESKSTIAFPEISRISWMRMTSYRRIICKTEKKWSLEMKHCVLQKGNKHISGAHIFKHMFWFADPLSGAY